MEKIAVLTVRNALVLDFQVFVCAWAWIREDIGASHHCTLGTVVASNKKKTSEELNLHPFPKMTLLLKQRGLSITNHHEGRIYCIRVHHLQLELKHSTTQRTDRDIV